MVTNDLYGNDAIGRVITANANIKIFLKESDKSLLPLPQAQKSSEKVIKSKGEEHD